MRPIHAEALVYPHALWKPTRLAINIVKKPWVKPMNTCLPQKKPCEKNPIPIPQSHPFQQKPVALRAALVGSLHSKSCATSPSIGAKRSSCCTSRRRTARLLVKRHEWAKGGTKMQRFWGDLKGIEGESIRDFGDWNRDVLSVINFHSSGILIF